MRLPALAIVCLALLGAGPSALPRGDDQFQLGMTRAQVDSLVAARDLEVISNGIGFLVCTSDRPAVEYEQYSFFLPPHGDGLLWKVTLGYRLSASSADFGRVREELGRQLGEPFVDTWDAEGSDADPKDEPRPPAHQQVAWSDALVLVQLAARWTESPDPKADRMTVIWTDRRLKRLVDARRKKESSQGS